jgi:gliding motility-associated lipoprotein GldH
MFRRLSLFSSLITLLFFSSCHFNDTFNQFADIPQKGWNQYDTLAFSPKMEKAGAYDIFIETRNTKLYLYRNVWLFVRCKQNNRTVFSDTLQITLADKTGRWLGSGWGSLYQLSTPYKANFKVDKDMSEYQIRIVQGMRDYDLTGIESVGVRIVPTNR